MPDDRANTETSTTFLGVGVSTDVASIQAPSSTNSSAVNIHNNLIQMNMSPAKYSITQGSIVDIKDWNLTMSQESELVYKNSNSMEPAYIKVGGVIYTLTVTSYQNLFPAGTTQAILLYTGIFTLTGRPTSRGFSFGGVTDVGAYSYTFETSSQTGASNAVVIT